MSCGVEGLCFVAATGTRKVTKDVGMMMNAYEGLSLFHHKDFFVRACAFS